MTNPRTLLVSILAVVLLLPAFSRAQQTCFEDAGCKAGKLCHGATCVKVGKTRSLLRVRLAAPMTDPAYLYLDDVLMGEIPFEGIVTAGSHAIRVQAHGMLPVVFQGESRGGLADLIVVELQADPARLAQPAQQPAYRQPEPLPQEQEPAIGRIHGGLYGGFGYGTAGWGDGQMRPTTILQGGVTAGVAALRDPVWIDVGLGISSTSIRIDDLAEDYGKFVKLNFGLLFRLLFPLKQDFFYLGAELEPGYGLSNRHYGYAQLHLALSLFFTDWIELRINPLGVEYSQDLTFQGFLLTGHATAGLILRFGTF